MANLEEESAGGFKEPEIRASRATLERTILPELDLNALRTVGVDGLPHVDSQTSLQEAGQMRNKQS